jgi:hypothetical protein
MSAADDLHARCIREEGGRVHDPHDRVVDVEELIDQAGLDSDKPDELDLAHFIMAQENPGARYVAMVEVLAGLLERIEGRR